MLGSFRKALGMWLIGEPKLQPSPNSALTNMNHRVFRDEELDGWMNSSTGELIAGFPISQADTVLDVGCGDGIFANFCAMQGAEIILADTDAARLANAGRMVAPNACNLISMVTDSNPLPLADAVATRVMAIEVVEHVDEPLKFLEELVRVGRKGALYFIAVPDAHSENLQRQLAPQVYFEKPNHIHVFDRSEFLKLIEDAGLTIEREFSYGFYSALWWVFFWACKQDLSPPWHPLLDDWRNTWTHLLATQQGPQIKSILDRFLPKSQAVIARKL